MTRIRRSLLFVPGNSPAMLLNAGVFGADSIIFDLEDAVAPNEKDAARILVRNAFRTLEYDQFEKIIRVNSRHSPFFTEDLQMLIPTLPDAILLPKVEDKQDIIDTETLMEALERENNLPLGGIKIIPLIETALGVENAFSIARSSKRISALFLGAEDLTADLGVKRTKKGKEILYSRGRIVIAARAAGITAIDTPFTDVDDEKGLIKDAKFAKKLGFTAKATISPRHVTTINRIFSPTEEEVLYAERVMAVIKKAEKEGKGVVALDGKMIDAPIVARAQRVLEIAQTLRGDLS